MPLAYVEHVLDKILVLTQRQVELLEQIASNNGEIIIKEQPYVEENITVDTSIEYVGFSNRVRNTLLRDGRFLTMQQLIDAYCDETRPLLKVRNLGRKGIYEIQEKLSELGFVH